MESSVQANSASPVTALAFRDFEEMEAAVGHVDARISQLGSGRFEGGLAQVHLDRILLQHGWQSVAHLAHAAAAPGMSVFLVPVCCEAEVYCNGQPVHAGHIAYYRPGADHFSYSTGGTQWLTLTIPQEHLIRAVYLASGEELAVFAESCRLFRPAPQHMPALKELLHRATHVLKQQPQTLAAPAAQRALGQSLVAAMVQSMLEGEDGSAQSVRTRLSHPRLVSKAEEYLRDRWHEPIYMSDVATATEASERSLRNAFQEVYGISPNRYLKIRRLNHVRRALRRGDPQRTTVTEVAGQFGFWDMSRLAIEYKALFGEMPSQTLRSAS